MLLYDQGLRAHFRRDPSDAFRLMSAALERDSLFVMAAYRAWVASQSLPDQAARHEALQRLRRLLPHAGDREQLMIRASLTHRDGPIATAVAIAETLAVRYPADLDGQLLLGRLRAEAGDWAGAVSAATQVVTNDSLSMVPDSPHCRACAALELMAGVYLWWDSASAAERVARRLVAARPADARAWHELVEPLLRQGRRGEAEAAVERMADLSVGPIVPGPLFNRDLIRWGRLEEVEKILAPDLHSPSSDIRAEALWLTVLQLRDQGRLREALALGRDGVIPGGTAMQPRPGREPLVEALLLVEMGRPAEAARLFRQEGERVLGSEGAPPGVRARGGSWHLTLAGVAYGVAGDTATVRRLADSVEVIGRGSTFGRDALLHHVLRGVLSQMRGRHEEAVNEFRRSMFSPTDGYTRSNLLLARSLLALQRPREAIAILRPALRGGVDGSSSHVSRTELHEALAAAFLQAGVADSAAAHFAVVARNWRRADPPFLERARRARAAPGGGD